MLLDTSIVSTVSRAVPDLVPCSRALLHNTGLTAVYVGHPPYYRLIPFTIECLLVWKCLQSRQCCPAALDGEDLPHISSQGRSIRTIGFNPRGGPHHSPLYPCTYTNNGQWSWLCFFAVFEIGSALYGAAQSSTMLIVGRAIAGAGASGLLSGAINIISSSVPLARRPALIGMVMGLSKLGTILGPVIGGAFTASYTWRWSEWPRW